jgi:hypothetical protein
MKSVCNKGYVCHIATVKKLHTECDAFFHVMFRVVGKMVITL